MLHISQNVSQITAGRIVFDGTVRYALLFTWHTYSNDIVFVSVVIRSRLHDDAFCINHMSPRARFVMMP